jgi:hypothetical protein
LEEVSYSLFFFEESLFFFSFSKAVIFYTGTGSNLPITVTFQDVTFLSNNAAYAGGVCFVLFCFCCIINFIMNILISIFKALVFDIGSVVKNLVRCIFVNNSASVYGNDIFDQSGFF